MGGVIPEPGAASLRLARLLALLVPAALLAGAYGSEYLGGLAPCEMCYWQRYAHWAALALALLAFVGGGRAAVVLAALAILASGGIGAWHAGIELGIFEGVTECTATATGSGEDLLEQILAAPTVRCDEVQFSFLGISMAGWNAILSAGSALVILWLSLRRSRTPA